MNLAPALQAKSEYRRFVFTYVYGGREWSLEVPALSAEEAKERLRVLPFARCEGERANRIAAPVAETPKKSWFGRLG